MPRLGSRVRVSFSAQKKVLGNTLSPGGGMVDALVSGASVSRRAGSSPVLGTKAKDFLSIKNWRGGGIGRRATLRG